MNRPSRSPSVARQTTGQGKVVILQPFDYTPLATEEVKRVKAAAKRIRRRVQRTLEDVIAVGQELLAVKETLPHGQFGAWLRAEFDWTHRTAGRFMILAQLFGSKLDTLSNLKIDLSAAYLLASPLAPEEASAAALQRAENGERITRSVAKQILGRAQSRLIGGVRGSSAECPSGKLWGQLLEILEAFRKQTVPGRRTVLAQQLRDFADSLQEE